MLNITKPNQASAINLPTPNVTIVVPCYNEEKRLDGMEFLNYLATHGNTKFIFVNDGSKDNTLNVLRAIQAQNPQQVQIHDMAQNGGKAEAVRQGMNIAAHQDAEYVGYWDADLATPLDAIEDFMRIAVKLPHVEVIFGARRSMVGHKIHRKVSRRIVSKICATLARIAVKLPINDTQAGAKIFKNTEAMKRAISREFAAGWLFDVELFARISKDMTQKNKKFFEYPLIEWTEIPGSKIDAAAIVKSGFVMLQLIAQSRLGLRTEKTVLSIVIL